MNEVSDTRRQLVAEDVQALVANTAAVVGTAIPDLTNGKSTRLVNQSAATMYFKYLTGKGVTPDASASNYSFFITAGLWAELDDRIDSMALSAFSATGGNLLIEVLT